MFRETWTSEAGPLVNSITHNIAVNIIVGSHHSLLEMKFGRLEFVRPLNHNNIALNITVGSHPSLLETKFSRLEFVRLEEPMNLFA